ncbi:adenosine kinase 2 isoform X1 [Musca autumnalis]|uniref:adenosine kinase 2 isoform X1 n=1 Tax=Musca autumnalis TaxID=221902 RepID=UPI003CE9E787
MENLREGILVGCGNPLLDISANVEEDLLQKYNLKQNDAILAEEKHMPLYKELIEKYKAEFIAGGSVQNSLRVCQWILQKPKVATFFGCVGNDDYAKILEENATKDGLNVRYQYNQEAPTGTCAVLVTGTHRSLCANLAAANNFTLDHLQIPENKKLLEAAEYYYISGFFLTVNPPSIMEVAHHAHNHNRTFMMNLSAPFLSQFFKEPMMAALPYVDILFGNEQEVETFANEQGWNTKDIKEIGRKLVALPKENTQRERIVIITQGHLPVLVFNDGKIDEFDVPQLKREEMVDTNGAGDAFVGGFLAQYVQKKPLEVCIRCGIWSAGEIIKRSGCTFEGKPTFEE